MDCIFMVGLIWFFFEKRTIFNPTIKFRTAIKATIKTPGKVRANNNDKLQQFRGYLFKKNHIRVIWQLGAVERFKYLRTALCTGR